MPLRILIISDPIAPPSYAPRVTSMHRYLTEAGHDVVLEAGQLPERKSLCRFVGDKLWWHSDRAFCRRLLHTYAADRFDVILCTSYYYFPLFTAQRLSRRWGIPYVVDLRDIVEQWGKAGYFTTAMPHLLGLEKLFARCYERHNLRLRNRVLRHAKAVTTVSPWHRDYLQTLTSAPVHLIYNGFDESELAFAAQPADRFSVAFIGRIMNLRLRQPHLLFEAVGEMLRRGEISADTFSLDFYAEPEQQDALTQLATHFGAADCLRWHGYIDRAELSDVMVRSSVLLALGCPPEDEQHGILGTKVFEAIGVEKPLLLVPSDEDSLAALIRETGIGFAARTADEVRSFLLQQYAEWQPQGYTRQTIDHRADFSRRAEALQMAEILRS